MESGKDASNHTNDPESYRKVTASSAAQEMTPPPPPSEVNVAELKRQSVRGGIVTFVSQGCSIAIQLASTVILSRLLSPEDYGLMAMVVAVTVFAGLFRDLGLSAASIQKGHLSHEQMSNLFWLNVGMGALLTAILAAASPLVAWFYGREELVPLTLLLSTTFLIGSLGTQHGALFVRSMQFGKKAVATLFGSFSGLIISILLAWKGYRYWALAWGNIVSALVTTSTLFALSPFRPGGWSSGAGIQSLLKFGANVTAFDIINYFGRNLDNILIGKFLGTDALGIYSRAYSLLMFPITAIRNPISAVIYPALSKLINEGEEYRKFYKATAVVLSMLTMPIVAICVLFSKEIIRVALGDKWLSSADVFTLLAFVAFVQSPSSLRGTVLMSCNQTKRYLIQGIITSTITAIGFVVGLNWGIKGVALSYVITTYIMIWPITSYCFKNTPLRTRDFFTALCWPCFITFCVAILTKITANYFDLSWIISIFIFFMIYSVIVFVSPQHNLLKLFLRKKEYGIKSKKL